MIFFTFALDLGLITSDFENLYYYDGPDSVLPIGTELEKDLSSSFTRIPSLAVYIGWDWNLDKTENWIRLNIGWSMENLKTLPCT